MRRIFKYAAVLFVLEIIACICIFAPAQAAGAITIYRSGNTITVSGTGFIASHSVTVSYDSIAEVSPVSDGSGNWSTSFSLPPAIAGTSHTISATDGTNSPTANFVMSPGITLSRTSGTTGNSVTITGLGFAASSNISITFNNVLVVTAYSDGTGNLISTSFTVPAAATGTYNVTATDTSGNTISTPFTNTVTPTITLTKTSGTVGSSLTVTGAGFAANEPGIQVTLNGTVIGSTIQAGASGAWSSTITVPVLPAGSYPVGAGGSATTSASVPTQSFNVTAAFALGKTSGIPNAVINVNGSGFASGEQNITLAWDGNSIGSPITAGANGSWTASFNVPVTTSGAHSVGVSGSTTAALAAISFTVSPSISTNKTNGAVGTSVTIAGNGFAANDGIAVTFDGTVVPGSSATADSNGSWTATFTVPVSAGSSHAVGAKGATTASVPTVTFTTLASISLNKTSGVAGSSITINGSGFAAGENNIIITYDNTQVKTGITADSTGSWSSTFTVPTSAAGTHTIKVDGPVTHVTSSGNQSFQVASNISLSPTTGYIGMTVNITGSGFATNSALSLYYDGTAINNVQATTDDSGNVSVSITIPTSKAGKHTLKVSDASNNNSTATFNVDNTPPPVPNPISPADGSKVGLTGNVTPTFKWSAVVDPNYPTGISYNLQIDTDSAFPHPLLEKDGLTTSHYTLMKSEALPRGQYYWRVQASDPASNVSAWSQPVMLNSGMMSSGLLALLIILVIVVIAVAVFLLLIRPATKRRKVQTVPAAAPAPASTPEIVIPDMVNAEFRATDTEDTTKRRALPWRLALPQATQPTKGAKTYSPEDQARLKVVIDFAKALPLMESGTNTDWLIELAENDSGNTPSPSLYGQLLKGEIQVRYEPAWIRHPTYNDLQDLLEGQTVLQDLNSFIDAVNRTASEAVQLLQSIYKDATGETTGDILDNGGWGFISGVYNDSIGWFLGKYLREPSDRDYIIKQEGDTAEGTNKFGLYGAQNTSFEGLLLRTPGEKEAAQMRVLHLKLRRIYRNSDKSKQMASLLTQLDVQRNRLVNAFSQFSRLNP